jgi:hypothetical protein
MALKKHSKKPLTVTEMARMGGEATAKKLTPEQRKASASKAAQARWAKARKANNSDPITRSRP